MLIDENKLFCFCKNALLNYGMSSSDAITVSNALVTTDKWGVFTHGTKNLCGYIEKSIAGGVDFNAKPEVLVLKPSLAVVDGHNAMGYVSSVMAMEMACDMAEKTGIAIVTVKNSCHFGAVGYYSNIAAEKGLIGCAMSNVDKKMTIPGAKGMVMGHNPFSLAAPAKSIKSIILDTSSSNVASLKVLRAKASGDQIPNTWISDKDGLPTTDPSQYPDEGALLPMGNYKGFGIAMFIEMLTSIIQDEPMSTTDDVLSWCFDLDKPNRVCHTFIAINPKLVMQDSNFDERVEKFIEDLHNAPKAKGNDRITVPGEDLWERYKNAEINGLDLPADVLNELVRLSKMSGVELDISKEAK